MDLTAIQPEIKDCAKRIVALMVGASGGAKSEADIQQNIGIVMGMLVQAIQHETEELCSSK